MFEEFTIASVRRARKFLKLERGGSNLSHNLAACDYELIENSVWIVHVYPVIFPVDPSFKGIDRFETMHQPQSIVPAVRADACAAVSDTLLQARIGNPSVRLSA
jgi:hypothetical protein